MNNEKKKFSFGENWKNYLKIVTDKKIEAVKADLEKWLGKEYISNKTIIDIGCGSGVHSLGFYLLGAKEILSIDIDPHSVSATKSLWEKHGKPDNWKIKKESVLDSDFISRYCVKHFDLVYSWGVLHHTGDMWKAMENATKFLTKGSYFWVALYDKGPRYNKDLALKKKYNRSSNFGKWIIEKRYIFKMYMKSLINRDYKKLGGIFLRRNDYNLRGMDKKHDLKDWLGGLPYEVASLEEIIAFARERQLVLEKISVGSEGANNICLFSKI